MTLFTYGFGGFFSPFRDLNLNGTDGPDFLFGRFGDDIISGNGGNDRLFGSFGDDQIDGGEGEDRLSGGFGDDVLLGGGGEDRLSGGFGDDLLIGGAGNDHIRGGFGDDRFIWNNGDGSDRFNGGFGFDTTEVNLDIDPAAPSANDDVIRIAEAGRSVILERTELNGQSELGLFAVDLRNTERLEVNAGNGEDIIELEGDVVNAIELALDGGADTTDNEGASSEEALSTGDTLDLSALDAGARVDLDENNQGVLQPENDLSNTTAPGLSEFGNVQVDGKVVIDELNDFENVIGTDFNDTIFGNSQNNVLLGGDGDDSLHPFGGTDFVDGGDGIDTLLLNGFPLGSHVDLNTGISEFIDNPGVAVNTFANIENVNGSSVAGDIIIGDANDNVLNGLGGDDELSGGAGNDTLIGGDNVDRARADAEGNNADILNGGEGDDILTGGLGADAFVFEFETLSNDTVTDFESGFDVFDVTAFGFSEADVQAVIDGAVDLDGSATFTLAENNTVTVQNVAAADLQVSDFEFFIA